MDRAMHPRWMTRGHMSQPHVRLRWRMPTLLIARTYGGREWWVKVKVAQLLSWASNLHDNIQKGRFHMSRGLVGAFDRSRVSRVLPLYVDRSIRKKTHHHKYQRFYYARNLNLTRPCVSTKIPSICNCFKEEITWVRCGSLCVRVVVVMVLVLLCLVCKTETKKNMVKTSKETCSKQLMKANFTRAIFWHQSQMFELFNPIV
jgi:hypothetical protein